MSMKAQNEITAPAKELLKLLGKYHLSISCAESLTGGLLAATITEIPGASKVYRGSINTYATDTKASLLGVDKLLIATQGPVVEEVALQMARGVNRLFLTDIGISTTGVAGPGQEYGIPAGTVWIAISGNFLDDKSDRTLNDPRQKTMKKCVEKAKIINLSGSRQEIREQVVCAVISLSISVLQETFRYGE